MADISANDRTRRIRIVLERPDPLLPYRLASTWAAPVPRGHPDAGAGLGAGRRALRGGAPRPRHGLRARPPPRLRAARRPARQRRRDRGARGAERGGAHRPGHRRAARRRRGRAARHPARRRSARSTRPATPSTRRSRCASPSSTSGSRPFRDEDVRRAVSFALDERTLTRLEEGFLTPTCNVIPQVVPGYRGRRPVPLRRARGQRRPGGGPRAGRRTHRTPTHACWSTAVTARARPRSRATGWRRSTRSACAPGGHARRAERRRAQLRFATRPARDSPPGALPRAGRRPA